MELPEKDVSNAHDASTTKKRYETEDITHGRLMGAGNTLNLNFYESLNHNTTSSAVENALNGGSIMNQKKFKSDADIKSSTGPVDNSRTQSSASCRDDVSHQNEDIGQRDDISGSKDLREERMSEMNACSSSDCSEPKKFNLNSESVDLRQREKGDNKELEASRGQTKAVLTDDSTSSDAEKRYPARKSSGLNANEKQTATVSKGANDAIIPTQQPSTSTSRKRPVKVELSSPRKQEKRAKIQREAAKADVSSTKDFLTYAELSSIKKERVWHKSLKPHILMKTAELEAKSNRNKKAIEAMTQALERMEHHSHPSAEVFHGYAKARCEEKEYLRACIFFTVSGCKYVREGKNWEQASDRIVDVAKTVKKMLEEKKARHDFSGGAHYSTIVKVVVHFMPHMYEEVFGANKKGSVTQAKEETDALGWMTEAFLAAENYIDAAKYGKIGLEIMNFAIQKKDHSSEKHRETAVRLRSGLGYAYHKQETREPEALKLLRKAVAMETAKKEGKRTENVKEEKVNQQKRRSTDAQTRLQEVEKTRKANQRLLKKK